jgi:serine/threonine protein kinase
MAPEQVRGETVDGRADLFSVGATLFRLLAMRRIHEVSSEADLFIKMGTEPAPTLLSVAPKVDPDLAAIVDRSLAFKAADRYPNAAAMAADVQRMRTRSLKVTAASKQRREVELNRTVPLHISMLQQSAAGRDNLAPDSTTAARLLPAAQPQADEAPPSMSVAATNPLAGQAATQAMSIAQLSAAAASGRSASSGSSARNGTLIQPTPQPPAVDPYADRSGAPHRSPSSGSSASNPSFVGTASMAPAPPASMRTGGLPSARAFVSTHPQAATVAVGPVSMSPASMGAPGVSAAALAALRETNPPRSSARDAAPPFAPPNAEWVKAAPGVVQLQARSGGGAIWIALVALVIVAVAAGAFFFFFVQ